MPELWEKSHFPLFYPVKPGNMGFTLLELMVVVVILSILANEPRLRRITVNVSISPEALTLATLEGFIRQPETLWAAYSAVPGNGCKHSYTRLSNSS